ncbi:MAG: hypothetical protein GX262_13560 [Clostridia bacterium]|jgi:hypothetical protein|nr:hypothetical protein [Clostridia bacterium]
MNPNETEIKSDEDFLIILGELITLFEGRNEKRTATHGELLLLDKLINIREIARGKRPLKTKQENYISLQRVLDDMTSIAITDTGKKIYEIVYYFSYVYKIPG